MNLKLRYKRKECLEWLLVFLVVFYSGSAYGASINNFYGIIKNFFTFSILLFWLTKYKGRIINKKQNREKAIWIPVVWFCILFINLFFHDDSIFELIIRISHVIFAYEIVYIVSWENFKGKYIKIIILICFISLFFHFCFANTIFYKTTMPQLLGYTPQGVLYPKYQGFLLYFNTSDFRNYGAFWEPGIFSTHIIIALLLLPYTKNIIYKKTYYAILLITVLSTLSSAGYVLTLMAIACNSIGKIFIKEKKDVVKIIFAFGITFCLVIIYINMNTIINALSLNNNPLFEKLLKISNSERALSIRMNWDAFMQRPILGYGFKGLMNSDWYQFAHIKNIVIDTATSFRLLAVLGIGGSFFTIVLLKGLIRNRKISIFGKIILIVIAIFIINKEAHDSFLIAWCFMMYLNENEDYKNYRGV